MRRRAWAVLAFVLMASCAEPTRAPFAHTLRDAGMQNDRDAVVDPNDAGPCALDGADPSLPACAPLPVAPLVLPEVEPAGRTPEARSEIECAAVPGVASFHSPASLHALGERVYVFSVDASEQVPAVLLHTSPLEQLAFAEPTALLYGAREVDLIAQGGTLRALAARQFYTVELESSDGVTFEEAQIVGPHEPTYNCEGYPPPRYFRGRDPAQLLAVGSDYNTGLFGCYERVFVARRGADGWAEPVEVGRGDVVFAFQGETRATVVTSLGVLQSDDEGETFQAIAGLDAAGGAFTGERLVLARAASDGIRALWSSDGGETWRAQTLVIADQAYGGAFIAADGPKLSIAVATATEIVLSTSLDGASTWTEPKRLARPSMQRLLALAQRGDATLWLTAGEDDSLELCVLR